MRLIRAADGRVMPWKNGGGETVEIAVFPSHGGVENFGWRVSRARVASDGPFSRFPGVDRTLAVLDGQGIELSIDGHAAIIVTADDEPLTFAADRSTAARLLSGPIDDLNVMTRRGAFDHCVTCVRLASVHKQAGSNHPTLLFCARGSASVGSGSVVDRLDRFDTLVIENPDERLRIEAEASAPTLLYRIEIRKL